MLLHRKDVEIVIFNSFIKYCTILSVDIYSACVLFKLIKFTRSTTESVSYYPSGLQGFLRS